MAETLRQALTVITIDLIKERNRSAGHASPRPGILLALGFGCLLLAGAMTAFLLPGQFHSSISADFQSAVLSVESRRAGLEASLLPAKGAPVIELKAASQ